MFLQRDPKSFHDPSEVVSALLRPLVGHSDGELTEWLTARGADVTILTDHFLSVRASRQTLDDIKAMAEVEIKAVSKLH